MLTRPLFRPLFRPLTRGVLDSPWGDNPTLDLNFASGSMPSGLTFTRSSSATYFDVDGVMQVAASNAPRITYDPVTKVCRGILIEEQRTNLLLNSATLATQSVAVTAQAYTLSFNGSGTVTLSGASTAGPLVGASNRVSLTFTPSAGTLTLTVSGSVTSAQLEAGTFPTSYIPTTSVAVTRAADNCSMALGAWFDRLKGTLYNETRVDAGPSSGAIGFAGFSDGTGNNLLANRADTNGTYVSASAFTNGANQTTIGFTGGVNYGQAWKIAHAYDSIGRAASGQGKAVQSVVGYTPMTAPDRLTIGGYPGGGAANGTVARVRYWNKRLPDAKLVSLTT